MVDPENPQYEQEAQRLHSVRTQVVLWLIVLALGVLLIPLMLVTGWVRNDIARVEADLLSTQSALESANIPSGDVNKLNADVAAINQLISSFQTVTVASGVNWPLIMDAATRYDAAMIELVSLTQSGDRIQITGRATSNDAVVRYQQDLLYAGTFKDVVVVSMTAAPLPTPAAATDGDNNSENDGGAATTTDPVLMPFGDVEFVIDLVVEGATP